MGFRTGLIVGLVGGYVLGSKAGRERYEEIKRAWDRITGSPAVQEISAKGKDMAGQAGRRTYAAVQRRVERVSTSVRDRLQGNGGAEIPPSVGGS